MPEHEEAYTDKNYVPTLLAEDADNAGYTMRLKAKDGKLQVDTELTLTGTTIDNVKLSAPADGTYIGDIKFGESLPTGTNSIGNIGTVTTLTGITNNVNIGDISKGSQTNDVKITLDSEVVSVTGTVTATVDTSALATSANQTNGTQLTKIQDMFGWNADCTPNAELITTDKIRLVGTIFNGAVVDTNFWTSYVSTGTVTQANSELILTSGTANTHSACVCSVRRANWVTGTSNKFRAQMRVGSSDDDVTVRFGVGYGATLPTITDGAYFKFVGSAVSVNTMANTSETSVASANFNGTYVAPTLTNNNVYEILYTLGKVYFMINNVIIHTATFSTTHWTSNTTNFHCFASVVNTGNSAAIPHTFRMLNICRLGNYLTTPQYKYIAGAKTEVCKLGGGKLHSIVVNQAGTTCTIYDQTSAAVPIIGILDTNKTTGITGSVRYECPFFNGLTVVTVGAGSDITVIYE
jgi:hypothetical protein